MNTTEEIREVGDGVRKDFDDLATELRGDYAANLEAVNRLNETLSAEKEAREELEKRPFLHVGTDMTPQETWSMFLPIDDGTEWESGDDESTLTIDIQNMSRTPQRIRKLTFTPTLVIDHLKTEGVFMSGYDQPTDPLGEPYYPEVIDHKGHTRSPLQPLKIGEPQSIDVDVPVPGLGRFSETIWFKPDWGMNRDRTDAMARIPDNVAMDVSGTLRFETDNETSVDVPVKLKLRRMGTMKPHGAPDDWEPLGLDPGFPPPELPVEEGPPEAPVVEPAPAPDDK